MQVTERIQSEGSLYDLVLARGGPFDRFNDALVDRDLVSSHGRGHLGRSVVVDLLDQGLSVGNKDLLVVLFLVVLAFLELLDISSNDLGVVFVRSLLHDLLLLLQSNLLIEESLRLKLLLMSLFLLLLFKGSVVFKLLDAVLLVLGDEVFGSLLVCGVSSSMLT